MRIGILTFHRAINYGGVLQCYALYQYLANAGHHVQIIDYRPYYLESYRKIIDFDNKRSIILNVKIITKKILSAKRISKRIKNFDLFLEMMKFTTQIKTLDKLSSLELDLVINGSDQIWNTRITKGYDAFYWGQYNHYFKVCTYAASAGHNFFNHEFTYQLSLALPSLDSISVREKDLSEKIISMGFKCDCCVDPTLLIGKNDLEEILIEPKEKNFICVYALKNEPEAVAFAEKIAEQKCLDVIVLSASPSKYKYKKFVKKVHSVTPQEFLGYIKFSYCNICISFHGVALSTLFHKDFYALEHETQGRYEQYLKEVGLESRIVNGNSNIKFSHVCYNGYEEKLAGLIVNSINYINHITK